MKNADNSLENQVIAMSNTLAEKSTRFTIIQQKMFYVCLASLKKGVNSKNEVEIDKQELFNYLNLNTDNNRWTRIRYEFKKLAHNSYIEFGTDISIHAPIVGCDTAFSFIHSDLPEILFM